MVLDPETPETPEIQPEAPENAVPEQQDPVSPQEEQESPAPVESEEKSSAEETPEVPAEPVAQPAPEAEPVVEEAPVVAEEATPEAAPVAEEAPAATEEAAPETEATAEAPAEEAKEPEPPLPPLPDVGPALLENLSTLAGDKSAAHVLGDVNIPTLAVLMQHLSRAEDVMKLRGQVGILKRTFDKLKVEPEYDAESGEAFLGALSYFNKRRSEAQKVAEAGRQTNLEAKKALLVELQQVVEMEDANKIAEVRAIQDKWKTIGHVPKEEVENLYKQYRFLLDKFYKLREMHFELLDYDRRINLQEKERLIEEAKKLVPAEEDRERIDVWREKMDMLAELQQQWKATGHVPREDMDRINSGYREAIDQFFEVRQGFMEIQDKLREEIGTKKQGMLEEMAQFKTFTADRPRAWNDATAKLKTFQTAWKELGQAPKSINSELWSRYRDICNTFFGNKSQFFKDFDKIRQDNLAKKRVLVERAEELVAQGEWNKAAREIKQLQKDWKTIGPVPERHSNKLWNRFRTACDSFFEKRRSHFQDVNQNEFANLDAKKELVEAARNLSVDKAGSIDAAIKQVKELQAKWKQIGRVPFKEKDNIWDDFRTALDDFFNGLSLKRDEMRKLRTQAQIESLPDSDDRSSVIRGKIARIRKKMQAAQSKVDQYSNNILFIAKGKKGDALRNQIQGEIDKEERLIKDLKGEIKALRDAMNNPPKPKEAKPAEEAPAAEAPAAETPEAEASEATTPAEEAATEAPAEEAAAPAAEAEAPAEEASEKRNRLMVSS
ncbi:MAG: DUF349 domain-containing protein [Bacteroidota bacterium]